MTYKKTETLPFLISFFTIIFFLWTTSIYAENKTKDDLPVNVTSDSMLAKKESSTIEFKGNVVVTREESVIHADTITLFFTKESEKNEKKRQKLKKIIAIGNVKYFSKERKAYAGKAVYTIDNEVLILTKDTPKVITNENWVTGKKITVFQKDGKITIEGGVNAVFTPENKTN